MTIAQRRRAASIDGKALRINDTWSSARLSETPETGLRTARSLRARPAGCRSRCRPTRRRGIRPQRAQRRLRRLLRAFRSRERGSPRARPRGVRPPPGATARCRSGSSRVEGNHALADSLSSVLQGLADIFGLECRVFLQDFIDGHAIGDHADHGGDWHPQTADAGATTELVETLRKCRRAHLLAIQESWARPPAFPDDLLDAACGGAPAPHYPMSSLPRFSRLVVCICSFVIPWDISPAISHASPSGGDGFAVWPRSVEMMKCEAPTCLM